MRIPRLDPERSLLWPAGLFLAVLAVVYGRLVLDPSLRPVFPENDLWNHPVRWSVAASLRQGVLPLWNPLTAFGMPWLAQFQTEVLYPGTAVFAFFGLGAWNLYSLAHLLWYAAGLHLFLRASGVSGFWSGSVSALSLVTLCAFHHLGSNAPSDTMAWIPWIFLGLRALHRRSRGASWLLGSAAAFQVLAGYPQIVLFTWLFALPYAFVLGGGALLRRTLLPAAAAVLVTCAQWLPGAEYFLFHAVRKPAMPDNPFHVIPLANLKTFLDYRALAGPGVPDYQASPSFFYHNLYIGLLPLIALATGLFRWKRLSRESRWTLALALLAGLGSFGFFVRAFALAGLPIPGVLEASKAWVLLVFLLLVSCARVVQEVFPSPGAWKWGVLVLALLDPARAAFFHPLERTLSPRDPVMRGLVAEVRKSMNGGTLLSLASPDEYRRLALAGEWRRDAPVMKHLVPNTNMLENVRTANGNGSTWPSRGTLNAIQYFNQGYPYAGGNLLRMLGVDVLHLPEREMPGPYRKTGEIDGWGIFANPGSVGARLFFTGKPRSASRQEAFEAFASNRADPGVDLFVDPDPVSEAPERAGAPVRPACRSWVPDPSRAGWMVRTENAMPGWRAWADGLPVPVHTANGIFLGVPYPRGTGQIALCYEPASFRVGLFMSLLTLGVLASMAGLSFPRSRSAK